MAGYWLEMGFAGIVLGGLLFETVRFRRNPRALSLREALRWSVGWLALAALFGLGVYIQYGPQKALEFGVGYIIEWSLSLDNLFVFVVIFSVFSVPEAARYRVLFWGILGAVILRGLFIAAGAALLARFEWILYAFGAFLVITGGKLLRQPDAHIAPDRNPVLRLFRRLVEVSPEYHGQRFFVRAGGRRLAPLRDRLHPGDLRHHAGSVHRRHLKHLRGPWAPRPVLPALRNGGPVSLPQARACQRPGLRGDQDAAGRVLPRLGRGLAGRRGWRSGRLDRGVSRPPDLETADAASRPSIRCELARPGGAPDPWPHVRRSGREVGLTPAPNKEGIHWGQQFVASWE